jgi:hypothetical protein
MHILIETSSVFKGWSNCGVQVRRLRAHLIRGKNRFLIFTGLLCLGCVVFKGRGRGKAVWVMKVMHRIINMDNLFAMAVRAAPMMAQRGPSRALRLGL